MPKHGKHFFTADTHYGHANIIKYCLRPFMTDEERRKVVAGEDVTISPESTQRMNREILLRANEAVGPDDVLWHIGDVSMGHGTKVAEYLEGLNCKNVFLFWGNHDKEWFKDYFPFTWDQALIRLEAQWIHCDHYPHDTWEGSHHGFWHVYGHVHGNRTKARLQNPAYSFSLDVGVDEHDFRPISFNQIKQLFESRRATWESWRGRFPSKDRGGMAPDHLKR